MPLGQLYAAPAGDDTCRQLGTQGSGAGVGGIGSAGPGGGAGIDCGICGICGEYCKTKKWAPPLCSQMLVTLGK